MSVAVSGIVLFALWAVGSVVQSRFSFNREKFSAYECGFDPNMSARVPLSLRLLLLAVILLVFDVEIALLMAIPLGLGVSLKSSVAGGSIFLIILFLGLLHEWREGSLNWL